MADISQELATIRTGIYGKDIRASIADALETVNANTGSGAVEVDTAADYEALPSSIKQGTIPIFVKALDVIILNGKVYSQPQTGGTIQVDTYSDYEAIAQDLPTGTAVFIRNSRLIVVDGVQYADTTGFKIITKLTQEQYDDAVDSGTISANVVYAIPE